MLFYRCLKETKEMRITKRSVDVKRHNKRWLVGGKWRTRKQAVSLARDGKINDVVICRGTTGHYIRSMPHVKPLGQLQWVMDTEVSKNQRKAKKSRR